MQSTLALTGVLNTTPNGASEGRRTGRHLGRRRSSPTGRETSTSRPATALSTRIPQLPESQRPHQHTCNPGLPIDGDYGDSFVKVESTPARQPDQPERQRLGAPGGRLLHPQHQATLDAADEDLGSGGPTLLPTSVGSAAHPNLLVGGGKEGSVYLIDRGTDNYTMTMGDVAHQLATDNVVQELGQHRRRHLEHARLFQRARYTITSGYGGPIDAFSISNGPALTTADQHDCRQLREPRRLAGRLGRRHGERHRVGPGPQLGSSCGPTRRRTSATRSTTAPTVAADAPPRLDHEVHRPHGGQRRRLRGHGQLAGDVWFERAAHRAARRPEQPDGHRLGFARFRSPGPITRPSSRASAFDIQRSTDGVNFTQIGTAGEGQTTYVDTTGAALHVVLLSRLRRQRHRHFRLLPTW